MGTLYVKDIGAVAATGPALSTPPPCAACGDVAGMQRYIDAFEARAASNVNAKAAFRMGDLLAVAMVPFTAQLNLLIREYDFHIERMRILRAIYGIRCRQATQDMLAWPWMCDDQICYPPFDRVATAYIAEFWQQFDCKDTELKSW